MPVDPDEAARKVGDEVRRLRLQAGYSQQKLADRIPTSQSTLSDIERGRARVKRDQAERLDQLLTSNGRLVALWETQFEGYEPPDWYREVPAMERRAIEIQDYNPLVVPGILQTQDYARATIRAVSRLTPDDEVDARARSRVERREILRGDNPPFLRAVVDQAVLHRRLGTPATMREQLNFLVEVSAWERAEILVVPSGGWNLPGLDGMFRLLRVPEAGTILYQETGAAGGVVIDPDTVDEHVALLSDLRGVALPPEQSRSLIEKVRGEYE